MPKFVAVVGRKGGTGKTLLSHLLAHGVGYMGGLAIMVITDVRTSQPPAHLDGRKYWIASVPQDETLADKLGPLLPFMETDRNSVMVFDGGANRRNIDFIIADLSDIVLIPTGPGAEEMEVAEADYHELSRHFREKKEKKDIFIVLNKWPGERRKRMALEAKPRIMEFIQRWDDRGMLLPGVFPYIQSFLDMADGADPKYSTHVDGKAREFARLVTKRLGLDIEKDVAEELARREAEELARKEAEELDRKKAEELARKKETLKQADQPSREIA